MIASTLLVINLSFNYLRLSFWNFSEKQSADTVQGMLGYIDWILVAVLFITQINFYYNGRIINEIFKFDIFANIGITYAVPYTYYYCYSMYSVIFSILYIYLPVFHFVWIPAEKSWIPTNNSYILCFEQIGNYLLMVFAVYCGYKAQKNLNKKWVYG